MFDLNKLVPEKRVMMEICGLTHLVTVHDFMASQANFQDAQSP